MALDHDEVVRISRVLGDVLDEVRNKTRLAEASSVSRSRLYDWASGDVERPPPVYMPHRVSTGLACVGRSDLAIRLLSDVNLVRNKGLIISTTAAPSGVYGVSSAAFRMTATLGKAVDTLRRAKDPSSDGGRDITDRELKDVIEALEELKRDIEALQRAAEADHMATAKLGLVVTGAEASR